VTRTPRRLPAGRILPPLALGSVETPLGPMAIACSPSGLVALSLPGERGFWLNHRPTALSEPAGGPPEAAVRLVERVAAELAAYFAGRLRRFSVPIAPPGTPFQRAVWQAVAAVPYAETRSYSAIAAEIGRPEAARAVGHANGANPLPIVVPCHRLVGANGSLTGYAGGLAMKRWLIEHERGHDEPT
jgi:methylated-DNA-[protein]-cysteine S-methyltransferase